VKKGKGVLCPVYIPEEGPDKSVVSPPIKRRSITPFKEAPTSMMSLVPANHVTELPFDPDAAEPFVHDGFFYAFLTKL